MSSSDELDGDHCHRRNDFHPVAIYEESEMAEAAMENGGKGSRKTPKRCWTIFGDDMNDMPGLLKALAAEFLGTFFLILVCVGSANSRTLHVMGGTGNPAYFLAISCAFGFGIGAIVHIISEASGGNVNPAVSLALFLDKRISLMRCILYTIVQFIGGFVGAGALFALGNHSEVTPIYGANGYNADMIGAEHAFFIEVLGTMFLILTILSTIDEKRGYIPSYTAPLSIGIAILVLHIWMIPYTNCSLNPVRGSVWNAVIGQFPTETVIFMFGPWVGGALAVPLYNFILK